MSRPPSVPSKNEANSYAENLIQPTLELRHQSLLKREIWRPRTPFPRRDLIQRPRSTQKTLKRAKTQRAKSVPVKRTAPKKVKDAPRKWMWRRAASSLHSCLGVLLISQRRYYCHTDVPASIGVTGHKDSPNIGHPATLHRSSGNKNEWFNTNGQVS